MERIKISFASVEFNALLRRAARNLDSKIDYQELINLLLPHRLSNYTSFRKSPPDLRSLLLAKAKQFHFEYPEDLFNFSKLDSPLKIKHLSIEIKKKFYDPLREGRNNYLYDRNYGKELDEYKSIFLDPNKLVREGGGRREGERKEDEGRGREDGRGSRPVRDGRKRREEGGDRRWMEGGGEVFGRRKRGEEGHDSIFGEYYSYLYEREKNEELFNKYGKRYVYGRKKDEEEEEEEEMRKGCGLVRKKAKEMQEILKRMDKSRKEEACQ